MKGWRRFNNLNRASRLESAMGELYDVIVIGGGITGAGIALDATLRGLSVLLLEKKDFASGTSSKSTKLIHGGLRYLKQLEFGLVRETGLERSVAHKNACHLVHPENMFLPIARNGSFSRWTAGMAISVYDRLAKVPAEDRKVMVSKERALEMEPLLDEKIIKSGIIYSEYRTDDARLTMALVKSAVREGAEAFNYLNVEKITRTDDVSEVSCSDAYGSEKRLFKGLQVVNATGPWADDIRLVEDNESETNLQLSKGVHLVVSRNRLPINNSTYFDAFDGRMLFAIPRGKVVYIGTTDTKYTGDLDKLEIDASDARYVLDAINGFFNVEEITLEDVQSSWAGLRPLIHHAGKAPTELSRKDEMFISDSGMISITGGKLTGFRKMAERVVDLAMENLDREPRPCPTKEYKLHFDPFADYSEFQNFISSCYDAYAEFVTQDEIAMLVSTFGKDALEMLKQAESKAGDSSSRAEELIKVQLDFCMEYESLMHPMDFLDRRTGWLYFDISKAQRNLELVTDRIKTNLKLSESDHALQLSECKELLSQSALLHLKRIKMKST